MKTRTLAHASWFLAGLGLVFLGAAAAAVAESGSSEPLGSIGHAIRERGLLFGFLAVFFGGLALNLTPCAYPMIPITLAFFSGQSATKSRRRTWALAILYVSGMALSYAVLGLLAAQAGALFGAWLQHPAVLVVIAGAIVGLALSMFGLYDLQMPSFITRRLSRAPTGLLGAFSMGLVFGVVVAPCIGPFIGSLVLYVAEQSRPVLAFFLFFVLGLGMGLPYLVLGVAAHRVRHLPKAGAWLVWSKKALGLVLLGLALWFIRGLLPEWLLRPAVAVLLCAGGVYLGWLERSRSHGWRFQRLRWAAGAVLVGAAVAVLWPQPPAVPGVQWVPFSQTALEEAQRAHRPIVIDVYADWCLPCVELDHVTFRHPDVVAALQGVTTLRLDGTQELSPEAEAFATRYRVFGMPTVLLFDRTGKERMTLRLLGFEGPREFLKRLAVVLERAGDAAVEPFR